MTYEAFQYSLLSKLMTGSNPKYYLTKYEELQSDEERIIFTINLMVQYNAVPPSIDDAKNALKSQAFREEGNTIFISPNLTGTKCVNALKLYTKSIAYAPISSEQLVLAYANRSAVLLRLRKYAECIKDVERALAMKCSDNIRGKLYIRKIACLKGLNNDNTDNIIREIEYSLGTMSLSDACRQKFIDKLHSVKSKKVSEEVVVQQPNWCTIKTYNAEASCASDAVAIVYNEEYGRHIVAIRDISPGETIVMEEPYSAILDVSKLYTHCSNCLEISWANIECDHCVHCMYCSEKCKALHWEKYHDVECKIIGLLLKANFNFLYILALRISVKILRQAKNIQKIRDVLNEINNWKDSRTKGFFNGKIWQSDSYRSVLSLVCNSEKRSARDLYFKSIQSSTILYFVAKYTNMFGSPLKNVCELVQNSDALFFGGLVLRMQQMISCNAHMSSELVGYDDEDHFHAVYPFCSLFNHSCFPNVSRFSKSKCNISYTVLPIKKGEQLFDNYGELYGLTSKPYRQHVLLKQYMLKCNCIPCSENWPPRNAVVEPLDVQIQKLVKNRRLPLALRNLKRCIDMAKRGDIRDKSIFTDLIEMIQGLHGLMPEVRSELILVVEIFKRVLELCGNRFSIPNL